MLRNGQLDSWAAVVQRQARFGAHFPRLRAVAASTDIGLRQSLVPAIGGKRTHQQNSCYIFGRLVRGPCLSFVSPSLPNHASIPEAMHIDSIAFTQPLSHSPNQRLLGTCVQCYTFVKPSVACNCILVSAILARHTLPSGMPGHVPCVCCDACRCCLHASLCVRSSMFAQPSRGSSRM